MSQSTLLAENRVIMVSGSNRGMGKAIAERLYRDGFRLSLGARRPETLHPVIRDMDPQRYMIHQYEATQPRTASAWVSATAQCFGRLDGLINNAGIAHTFSLENDDEEPLDLMWEVNVKGPLRLIRAAYPHLKNAGSGRVINIVSLSGKRVKSAAIGAYAMSKHAALALTHATRFSGWDHGIRATAIMPGWVNTDMAALLTPIPHEQMTQPETIAALVATVLALPNTASIAELAVNCVLESSY
jgi:NAD(P)-dependent dehydrogenase (short-subunit alcohol dehydrogenase family)